MPEERRRFTRIPFKVNAEITVNNTVYIVKEISNLSVGGCLVCIKADVGLGTNCHVKILLSGTISDMSIEIDGKIKHRAPEAVAIQFTRIDPEGLFHLHNIVRYNSPDPDTIDREIREHPGLV